MFRVNLIVVTVNECGCGFSQLDYRLVFVWSEAKQRQEAATRERHVAKIQEEFEAVERNLNKYSLKTEDAVLRRLEAARGALRARGAARRAMRATARSNPRADRESRCRAPIAPWR